MSVTTRFILWTGGALVIAAGVLLWFVDHQLRDQALAEAQTKARIILDRNLATHTYFSHELKPSLFRTLEGVRSADAFDPVWMSSTYAVRGIDAYFKKLSEEDYYYKECAINARNPLNEADAYERAFIKRLNTEPTLESETAIRQLDGSTYYVVLRRGEVMEQACLRCHSQPARAPAELVKLYGPERSFHRSEGEVVSAISIRVPLTSAIAQARQVKLRLGGAMVVVLLLIGVVMWLLNRYLLTGPLEVMRRQTAMIASSETHLGEQLPLQFPAEWNNLASDFNLMSQNLRQDRDSLEERVHKRTAELEQALKEVKQLSGILPICANCKKIRDDEGYWQQVEGYIQQHSEAQFSHGLCPACVDRLYPELVSRRGKKDRKAHDGGGSPPGRGHENE